MKFMEERHLPEYFQALMDMHPKDRDKHDVVMETLEKHIVKLKEQLEYWENKKDECMWKVREKYVEKLMR